MIIGRTNALEIVLVDGRPVARRYSVFFRVEHGAKVVDAECSDEPLEELVLPLTREAATAWLWQHFEELGPDRIGPLIARLVRPTGPLL